MEEELEKREALIEQREAQAEEHRVAQERELGALRDTIARVERLHAVALEQKDREHREGLTAREEGLRRERKKLEKGLVDEIEAMRTYIAELKSRLRARDLKIQESERLFVARVAESAVRALRAQSTPSPDNGSRWPGSDAETLSAPSDEENSP